MPSAILALSCLIPPPSSGGGTHELLLTNRICQRWYDVLDYVYTLQKIVTHFAKRLCLPFAGFEDPGCHASELLCGGEHVTRSWRWPPAQRKKTEALNLETERDWILPTTLWVKKLIPHHWASDEITTWPTLWLQLWKILKQRTQLNCSQIPDPKKLWRNKCGRF